MQRVAVGMQLVAGGGGRSDGVPPSTGAGPRRAARTGGRATTRGQGAAPSSLRPAPRRPGPSTPAPGARDPPHAPRRPTDRRPAGSVRRRRTFDPSASPLARTTIPACRSHVTRSRLAVAAALAPLALLAACAQEEEPTSSQTASADECAKDQLPLKQAGTLTIGTDSPAYEPWFADNDPTNGKGYESAVAYAVAEELGFAADEVTWVKVPFNNSYARAQEVRLRHQPDLDHRRRAPRSWTSPTATTRPPRPSSRSRARRPRRDGLATCRTSSSARRRVRRRSPRSATSSSRPRTRWSSRTPTRPSRRC